ncbi:unnamed protein product [Durusdinium trenchii]|uniref:PNPLA domain-containing protein n=1 Tax=Durusdinium trenchii TaxID=1381693 RepID=A0ABP0HE19_9DINO
MRRPWTLKMIHPGPSQRMPLQRWLRGVFAHMFEERFSDLRRRQLSQVSLLSEPPTNLAPGTPLAVAVFLAAWYVGYVLVVMSQMGSISHTAPAAPFELGTRELADIQWGSAALVSFGYCFLVFVGVRYMERRSSVRSVIIFEIMAVYNSTQVLLNLYEVCAILYDMISSDFRLDSLPKNVAEPLIWLQYHCRQMELLDTFFLVLRKKFDDISLFHMYYRVLNMWGWFFGFHYACVGPTLVPALVTSVAQTLQYLSFTMAIFGVRKLPLFCKAPIAELQTACAGLCMLSNLFMAVSGRLPIGLAMLHAFVFFNGVVLYTDFHFRETHPLREKAPPSQDGERVTFSFDSAGWLYVYQFGVAAFLQEHLMPPNGAPDPEHYPRGLGFSGSSAGALTASLLASGTSVPDVFEHVLAQYKVCRRRPWKMAGCAEEALRKYQFPGAFRVIAGRLRILVTRALWRPPFIMGEVVDEFPDNETAIQLLMASCHIPAICGFFPKKIGDKYYYDGMMWSSLFVPWRGAKEDHIVKVSGIGGVMSDIRPPLIPPWWCILPPPVRVLRGLYWQGYLDALLWFRAPPRQLEGWCGRRDVRERAPAAASSQASSQAASQAAAQAPAAARRNARRNTASSAQRKWQVAKALLKQSPPKLAKALAVCDPSGETVRTLLKDFYDARSYTMHLSALCCCALLLPLGAITPQIRSTVLGLTLVASVAFAWHTGEDKRVAK